MTDERSPNGHVLITNRAHTINIENGKILTVTSWQTQLSRPFLSLARYLSVCLLISVANCGVREIELSIFMGIFKLPASHRQISLSFFRVFVCLYFYTPAHQDVHTLNSVSPMVSSITIFVSSSPLLCIFAHLFTLYAPLQLYISSNELSGDRRLAMRFRCILLVMINNSYKRKSQIITTIDERCSMAQPLLHCSHTHTQTMHTSSILFWHPPLYPLVEFSLSYWQSILSN